jgi:hypothetical protein
VSDGLDLSDSGLNNNTFVLPTLEISKVKKKLFIIRHLT